MIYHSHHVDINSWTNKIIRTHSIFFNTHTQTERYNKSFSRTGHMSCVASKRTIALILSYYRGLGKSSGQPHRRFTSAFYHLTSQSMYPSIQQICVLKITQQVCIKVYIADVCKRTNGKKGYWVKAIHPLYLRPAQKAFSP